MDKYNSITISVERKPRKHLGAEKRYAIQELKNLGYSNRAIARTIHCSPSTVGYELQGETRQLTAVMPDSMDCSL